MVHPTVRNAQVKKWKNMHFRPCLPVCDWYWPCIRPCLKRTMKSCRCSHHGPRIYFSTSPIIFTAKKLKQASPGGGKITTKQLRHLCVCVHSVFVCLFWFCVFVLCVFVLCVFALCVFALHDYPTMQYYVLNVAFTAAGGQQSLSSASPLVLVIPAASKRKVQCKFC